MEKINKKIILGNDIAVVRLTAPAFDLMTQLLLNMGYKNLVQEIVHNTTIEKNDPTIIEAKDNG